MIQYILVILKKKRFGEFKHISRFLIFLKAKSFKFALIQLRKWNPILQPGVTWKSDTDINTLLENTYLSVFFVNSYMDFDDYDTPIKNYVNDRYTYRGIAGHRKNVKMYIKENSVELSDNIIGIGESEEQEFISIDNEIHDVQPFIVSEGLFF